MFHASFLWRWIKTLKRIENAFNQGIEKVIKCYEAGNMNLIQEASKVYGNQSIAVYVCITPESRIQLKG